MSGTGRSQYLEPFNQIFFRAKFINFFLLVRELTPGPRSVWPNIHLWDRADSEGSEGELGQDDPLRCYLLLLFSRVRQAQKYFEVIFLIFCLDLLCQWTQISCLEIQTNEILVQSSSWVFFVYLKLIWCNSGCLVLTFMCNHVDETIRIVLKLLQTWEN